MQFQPRLGGESTTVVPGMALCDVWLCDNQRVGDEVPGGAASGVVGRWPGELETEAVVRLAQVTGSEPGWERLASTPPLAQRLDERAHPQPLDIEIRRHLKHLQFVCHRPRLHLRVEEDRLPVGRARRVPVRAIAELVSHPADWEHRTLRSIQPARVLSRQSEDEWDLYENRVAACLVDHLLAYLARRLEELRRIDSVLRSRQEHGDEARYSFWRARRVMGLWADSLGTKTEEALRNTIHELALAQGKLQALLDSPLYRRLPARRSVALVLKPTNILVNDAHYRKVAVLWRAWVKHGHKAQETSRQRTARRHTEAQAWDRFVLHIVVRALAGLGWNATAIETGWRLDRSGWESVTVGADELGVIDLRVGSSSLQVLPLCADFTSAEESALTRQMHGLDAEEASVVLVHVGDPAKLTEVDVAMGWSFGKRTVLLGCSPWAIDSEERMCRLIHGWLGHNAIAAYPYAETIRGVPSVPSEWDWLRVDGYRFVALRAPDTDEVEAAQVWSNSQESRIARSRATTARRAPARDPQTDALLAFRRFVTNAKASLASLGKCPVCPRGWCAKIDCRHGNKSDCSAATWWATCRDCESQWGLRRCTGCEVRYRVLLPQTGLDLEVVASATSPSDWPDKVFGRDVWAQPCGARGMQGDARCPNCGMCTGSGCSRCSAEKAL
jgi:hypothetical protein